MLKLQRDQERIEKRNLGKYCDSKESSDEQGAVQSQGRSGALVLGGRLARCRGHDARTSGGGSVLSVLFKSRESDGLLNVRVRDIHAGRNVNDVLVGTLETGIVIDGKGHGLVVNLVGEDDSAAVGKSTVLAHLDKVLVVLIDSLGGDTGDSASGPVIGINVPEDSSQVELSSDPSDSVVQITLCLILGGRLQPWKHGKPGQ